jgi:hypothetical protein
MSQRSVAAVHWPEREADSLPVQVSANRARISPLGAGLFLVFMAIVQMALWAHISDDAYISFRYVERWVEGQGLTFNPGERVEGFSNPLWIAILALSRRLLPTIPIVDAARILGCAASVISFLAMAAAVTRSSPGRHSVAFLYAAVILACTPGFHVYATAGLETPVFGMLVTVAVLFSLTETFAMRFGAALCLGLAAVCRPEAALYGLLWWLFTRGPRQLRTRSRHEMIVMAALSVPFVGYEAFRVAYFGELLPNTFLAKPPGIFGGIFGIAYLLQWAIALGGPLLFVVWLLRRAPLESEAGRLLRASAGPLLAATIFVVYTRGDWMPFGRFLVPVAPLMAACVGTLLARWTIETARERRIVRRRIVMPVAAALGLSAIAAWNSELGAYIRNEGNNHIMRGTDQVATGQWLAEHINAGSTVATKRLGGVSFAAPDLIVWDLLGLTDREQARFVNAGKMFGGGQSPVERRLPDVMAVTDIPGSIYGYKSEPGTLPWLVENYVLVKTLPQGNSGTFDIWVAKKRFEAVVKRSDRST